MTSKERNGRRILLLINGSYGYLLDKERICCRKPRVVLCEAGYNILTGFEMSLSKVVTVTRIVVNQEVLHVFLAN